MRRSRALKTIPMPPRPSSSSSTKRSLMMLPTASATVLPPDQRLGSLQVEEPVPVLPVLEPVCDPVAGDQDESVPAATGSRDGATAPLVPATGRGRSRVASGGPAAGGASTAAGGRGARKRVLSSSPPVLGWLAPGWPGVGGALGGALGVRKTVLSPSDADGGAGARDAGAPPAGWALEPAGARNRVFSASTCTRVASTSARYASPAMRLPRY